MKPTRCNPPEQKASGTPQSAASETVKVFCRIKPIQSNRSCVNVRSPTTISLQPPGVGPSHRLEHYKEIQHTFSYVFDNKATQKDVFERVALPAVESVLRGKNGLIFTYGVTGSGKTFTMTGGTQDGGIMPRCLDAIFNSICNHQAMKCTFKPDAANGFYIQGENGAIRDVRMTPGMKKSSTQVSERVADNTKIEGIERNNVYAVFVSYIEIYNNNVYDLLEELPRGTGRSNQPQAKNIREDACHNMYVHFATQMEVTSSEEAFEVFQKGQKRKRTAITKLNSESSRSHSIFTVRLVQAPIHSLRGMNRRSVCVSQLTLVDLAGCERTKRTGNRGERLRETGQINTSLMTLRICFEIMRENKLRGMDRKLPYRDSKMTLLFKRFFEGEGQVSMLVCLNPSVEEYPETIHVMKFSEMTKEVPVDFVLPTRTSKDCDGEGEVVPDDIDHSKVKTFNYQKALYDYWQKLFQDFSIKLTELEEEKMFASEKYGILQNAVDQGVNKLNTIGFTLDTNDLKLPGFQQEITIFQ
jgi:kinesin family protein 23